jgi:hypothetical protein
MKCSLRFIEQALATECTLITLVRGLDTALSVSQTVKRSVVAWAVRSVSGRKRSWPDSSSIQVLALGWSNEKHETLSGKRYEPRTFSIKIKRCLPPKKPASYISLQMDF